MCRIALPYVYDLPPLAAVVASAYWAEILIGSMQTWNLSHGQRHFRRGVSIWFLVLIQDIALLSPYFLSIDRLVLESTCTYP